MHICAYCRFIPEDKKADCAKAKMARQQKIIKNSWSHRKIEVELRPILARAITDQNWELVSRIWKLKRWMVKKASQGK
jgi:hypothetical protein